MMNQSLVVKKYNELCLLKSDINELLPFLKDYAGKSKHITEMGVRDPTSTYAFLAGGTEKLVSYDIKRNANISEVEALAPGVFTFILQDVLEADIEETDFLFIDTYHTATQLEGELARHSEKARKYIGLHDTSTFWETGEAPYEGMDLDKACGKGLKHAVLPFLRRGGWRVAFMTEINNGLIIMERRNSNVFSAQALNHWKYLFYLRSVRFRNLLKRLFNRS
ncbi:hypothetical protein KXD93_21125 [Mucilaginibacter sp. BJC16-A38]|uniref:hypothetical protein n=1 Tax=Mucilaginibacter phenanthrenivorans TaxID=1234842 RepID=UPI0021572B4F|nr:hypothetical protein [Mucilaginibacter phenanthrenivorans]MCR8560168.1 hypothetical protein [Mucilaginibacter phenanthrenivorans]